MLYKYKNIMITDQHDTSSIMLVIWIFNPCDQTLMSRYFIITTVILQMIIYEDILDEIHFPQ